MDIPEIRRGQKIITPGLEKNGIEYRLDGQFDVVRNGPRTEIIAKDTGRAELLLMYAGTKASNYCDIKYYIPFVVTP